MAAIPQMSATAKDLSRSKLVLPGGGRDPATQAIRFSFPGMPNQGIGVNSRVGNQTPGSVVHTGKGVPSSVLTRVPRVC